MLAVYSGDRRSETPSGFRTSRREDIKKDARYALFATDVRKCNREAGEAAAQLPEGGAERSPRIFQKMRATRCSQRTLGRSISARARREAGAAAAQRPRGVATRSQGIFKDDRSRSAAPRGRGGA